MKKEYFTLLPLVLLFTLMFSMSVCAYSYNDYECAPDTGFFYVDNFHDTDSHVTLYTLVKPNNEVNYQRGIYEFVCVDGVFEFAPKETGDYRYYQTMEFNFRPENKEIYKTIGDYEIWVWQFGIENGDYLFARGGCNMGITTLNKNNEFIPEEHEVRTVENENIRLYGAYGFLLKDEPEAEQALLDFANDNEAAKKTSEYNKNKGSADSVSTIEEEGIEQEINIEETTSTEELKEELKEEDENTDAIEPLDTQQTLEDNTSPETVKDSSNLESILKTFSLVLIIIFLLYVAKKAKKYWQSKN